MPGRCTTWRGTDVVFAAPVRCAIFAFVGGHLAGSAGRCACCGVLVYGDREVEFDPASVLAGLGARRREASTWSQRVDDLIELGMLGQAALDDAFVERSHVDDRGRLERAWTRALD